MVVICLIVSRYGKTNNKRHSLMPSAVNTNSLTLEQS